MVDSPRKQPTPKRSANDSRRSLVMALLCLFHYPVNRSWWFVALLGVSCSLACLSVSASTPTASPKAGDESKASHLHTATPIESHGNSEKKAAQSTHFSPSPNRAAQTTNPPHSGVTVASSKTVPQKVSPTKTVHPSSLCDGAPISQDDFLGGPFNLPFTTTMMGDTVVSGAANQQRIKEAAARQLPVTSTKAGELKIDTDGIIPVSWNENPRLQPDHNKAPIIQPQASASRNALTPPDVQQKSLTKTASKRPVTARKSSQPTIVASSKPRVNSVSSGIKSTSRAKPRNTVTIASSDEKREAVHKSPIHSSTSRPLSHPTSGVSTAKVPVASHDLPNEKPFANIEKLKAAHAKKSGNPLKPNDSHLKPAAAQHVAPDVLGSSVVPVHHSTLLAKHLPAPSSHSTSETHVIAQGHPSESHLSPTAEHKQLPQTFGKEAHPHSEKDAPVVHSKTEDDSHQAVKESTIETHQPEPLLSKADEQAKLDEQELPLPSPLEEHWKKPVSKTEVHSVKKTRSKKMSQKHTAKLPVEPYVIPAVLLLLGAMGGLAAYKTIKNAGQKPLAAAFFDKTLSLPVFGQLPWIPENQWRFYRDRQRPETPSGLDPAVMAAYQDLAKNLRQRRQHTGEAALLFSTVQREAGKAPILANLGYTLAQGGERVLLVDGNLARPALHRDFNHALDYERSLPELINGIGEMMFAYPDSPLFKLCGLIENMVTPTGLHPGLDYLNAGLEMTPTQRQGFLNEPAFQHFVEAARESYDWVLVNGTPITAPTGQTSEEASALLGWLDSLVIMVERDVPKKGFIEAYNRIRGFNHDVSGVIIRKV